MFRAISGTGERAVFVGLAAFPCELSADVHAVETESIADGADDNNEKVSERVGFETILTI